MNIDSGSIKTKIGCLDFEVEASEGGISDSSIVLSKIEPVIPLGMEVESCIAVLLTLVSPTAIRELKFSCVWRENETKGFSCSGEGLDAWEWDSDRDRVVIGTEDEDWLFTRLNLGDVRQVNYPVSMSENRITITLERYPANTELTLHFVVSSNTLPEEGDCSCWYAVDIAHERVIDVCRLS